MNVLEFIAKSERYRIASFDDHNAYRPHVIESIKERLEKVTALLACKALQKEDQYHQYHIKFPTVWVEFSRPEFDSSISTLFQMYGYMFEEDDEPSTCRADLLEMYNTYDDKSYFKGGISVWKGVNGLEFTVRLGDFSVIFIAEEGALFLCDKHLCSTPDLDHEYVRFMLDIIDLVAEQYHLMNSVGQEKYYTNLNVTPCYRHGYMTTKDYYSVAGTKNNDQIDTDIQQRFLDDIEQWKFESSQGISLTKSRYLDAIKLCLDSVYPKACPMTAVEAYRRFCDGRHEGLLDIEDTAEAFDKWYHRSFRDTCHAEIVPSGSKSTAVYLFAEKVKGKAGDYYFRLHTGTQSYNFSTAIRMAIALKDAGKPVQLDYAKEYATRIEGKSIVVFPSKFDAQYDKRYFPQPSGKDCLIEFIEVDVTLSDALDKGWPITLYDLSD